MSDNGSGIGLDDIKADRLRDVAYSAEIDTEGVTNKSDLVERLEEANVRLGPNGWERDGDSFELEERPSGTSGPSDMTALYAFERENEHCAEVIGLLEDTLDGTDYVLRRGETSSGKKTVSVVLPAEAQETDDGGDEEETYTCAGTKADGSPCTREVEEEGAYCYQHGPDEE